MNYKFGNKNQWRRTIWNRIRERITVPAQQANVLYLAGPEDFDRKLALDRGFRGENMIAVEASLEAVAALRKRGVLVVQDCIVEVLKAWPESRRLDVLHLDFCCGLEPSVIDAVKTACVAFPDAVIAVNVLRGRDARSNQFRAEAASILETETRHRGEHLFAVIHDAMADALWEKSCEWGMKHGPASKAEWQQGLSEIWLPAFLSYRSAANQTFDSLVMRSMPDFGGLGRKDRVKASMRESSGIGTRRRVAATLAHQTMTRERSGPYRQ